MALRQFLSLNKKFLSNPSCSASGFATFSPKSNPYIVKVGIPEFLTGLGKGVEKHVEKLESELGDFQKLLVTRTLKLKKLGIPCKEVGILEFLTGVGKGMERHVEKLEFELGGIQKLLVTLYSEVKKLGIPCKERKLILKYAHKYRLGLWRPRAEPAKA